MPFGSTRSPHLNLPICIAIAVTQHHRLVICNQHKLVSPSHGAGSPRRRPSCWVSGAAAARSGGDHSSVLPWWEVERLFCWRHLFQRGERKVHAVTADTPLPARPRGCPGISHGPFSFVPSLASLQVTSWCAFSSAASTDDEMSTHESLFCLFSHFIWLLQFPAVLWNSRVYAVLIVIWLGPLKRLLQRYETKLWLRVVICFSFVRYFRLVRGLLFLLRLHYSSKRKRFPLFLPLPHALPSLLFRYGSPGREESLPSSLLELTMDNWDGTNFIFDWSSRGWTSFVLL